MPTEVEIAWAAGLFEGEGCALESTRLQLHMTDRDVMETFNRTLPSKNGIRPRIPYASSTEKKPSWIWTVSKADTVVAYIDLLLPYMHARRRAKFIAVRAGAQAIIERRGICKNGHKIEGKNKHNTFCRTCQNQYKKEYKRRLRARKKAEAASRAEAENAW